MLTTFLIRTLASKQFFESLLDLYESIYSISLISLRYLINNSTTLNLPPQKLRNQPFLSQNLVDPLQQS